MERLTEWLPAGTAANVKYPVGADAVIKSAYKQKAFDRLAAYEDTGRTPQEIMQINEVLRRNGFTDALQMDASILQTKRDNADLRNELCLKCGMYKTAHEGSCDGCRWRKHNV